MSCKLSKMYSWFLVFTTSNYELSEKCLLAEESLNYQKEQYSKCLRIQFSYVRLNLRTGNILLNDQTFV